MEVEKDGLPRYTEIDHVGKHKGSRRLRKRRLLRLLSLFCLVFLAYTYLAQPRVDTQSHSGTLSKERLRGDLASCSKLRSVPKDPSGLREKNARYIDGHKPILIRNATVWTGEPVEGTTPDEARLGKGYSWIKSDVLMQNGLIVRVDADISEHALPHDCEVWNAEGRQLTTGIIDMHSHAGVDPLPSLVGGEDDNELSADITPFVRSIDGFNPLDPHLQVIKSGGVTTSLILPGSGNNIGGEAYVMKHAIGKADGRSEIAPEDMLADPDRNWRYIKMACGENAKRVYGDAGKHGPYSRLGEAWEFRHAFEQAAALVKAQDDWCDSASVLGAEKMTAYLPQDLKWETLGAVLRGQVHVNTHCYTIPDLESFVRHTNEFKFPIRAFHHAHQTYLVPEILKRAYGGRPPASALFADNMYYKAESYVASEQAARILYDNGLTPVFVSDNPVLNAQHVVFEAAKAYQNGLPYHVALAGVTSASAELLGLGERIGKIKEGFDADVVVWDSDPLSVGATPVQVWIDGTAQFDHPYVLDKPVSAPIKPDPALARPNDLEPEKKGDMIFTGISKIISPTTELAFSNSEDSATVVISDGRITCAGHCDAEVASTSDAEIISLTNGYLTPPLTAFNSFIGIEEIQAEDDTSDGSHSTSSVFSRAIDGLGFETKQLKASWTHGVTRAISAPKFQSDGHKGVSVAFRTTAKTALHEGTILKEETGIHYTLTEDSREEPTPSTSSGIASLRGKLLKALTSLNKNTTTDPSDLYTEQAYLQKVLLGTLPLVITVNSADTISSLLTLKSTILDPHLSSPIRLILYGAAEAHLLPSPVLSSLTPHLNTSIVLSPRQAYSETWSSRRSLTGAPLTNGTTLDILLDAGVAVGLGVAESWDVRNLRLHAGWAYRNSEGRLSEADAWGLVAGNLEKMVGLVDADVETSEMNIWKNGFLIWDGKSPLEIGTRLRAIGDGMGEVGLFHEEEEEEGERSE